MDREKVIKGLESLYARLLDVAMQDSIIMLDVSMVANAIDLLKEQEAVKPNVSSAEQRCGNCNKVIEMDGWKSCPWCGKHIDWKGWWEKNDTRNQDTGIVR